MQKMGISILAYFIQEDYLNKIKLNEIKLNEIKEYYIINVV